MATGRKPAPANLRLLNGRSAGRDSGGRKVQQPPSFVRLPPEPPEWLSPEARAEWDRVVPELQRLQLTKPADRAALAAYCEAWARLVTAQMELSVAGLLTEGSQGQLVRHPAVAIAEAASKELRAWCTEFGFTPSSEGRLARPKGDDDGEANPFAGTG